MAKPPKKSSRFKISNIMGLLRGEIPSLNPDPNAQTKALGSLELISLQTRSKLLEGATQNFVAQHQNVSTNAGILGIVQASLSKMGGERIENRKILTLMPEVRHAANLMIASTFAPNDLSRQNIKIVFKRPMFTDEQLNKLSEFATNFFQEKLNLKTAAPEWVYQFGYEAGCAIFGIIPETEFGALLNDRNIGTENFTSNIVEQVSTQSLFGFSDNPSSNDLAGIGKIAMESLCEAALHFDGKVEVNRNKKDELNKLVNSFIATEKLSLTDNPSVLQVGEQVKSKVKEKTKRTVRDRYRRSVVTDTIITLGDHIDELTPSEVAKTSNPILMRFPPESVTVIHTPGNPDDHVGYFILLDRLGNPIDAVVESDALATRYTDYTRANNNLFNQLWQAHGLTSNNRGLANHEVMTQIYTQIVASHLKKRVEKVGFENVVLGDNDSVMRCMFSRFLEGKQTRVLFLPKELITYMTFEKDQNGNGVSRLDGIKFSLGMKMAVQVSRVLASIKAAADNRKIEVKFTENMIDNPEAILQMVIQEYVNKSSISFSSDPNVIQNQIISKALSVRGIDMPGLETFDITNEPDNRTGSTDFDSGIMDDIDKQIQQGLRAPPAAMNALSENEYSRSVATTNLFFALEIGIDQETIILLITDLIRKYGRYSGDFIRGLMEIIPELGIDEKDEIGIEASKNGSGKKKQKEISEKLLDEIIDNMSISLPSPQVAPSKAQFEALDAMITSIGNTIDALLPDDYTGVDDEVASTIRFMRAKYKALNIRNHLESSGMTNIDIPDGNFAPMLKELGDFTEAIQNVHSMLKDKAKLKDPDGSVDGTNPLGDSSTDPMAPPSFGEGGEDDDTTSDPNKPPEFPQY